MSDYFQIVSSIGAVLFNLIRGVLVMICDNTLLLAFVGVAIFGFAVLWAENLFGFAVAWAKNAIKLKEDISDEFAADLAAIREKNLADSEMWEDFRRVAYSDEYIGMETNFASNPSDVFGYADDEWGPIPMTPTGRGGGRK